MIFLKTINNDSATIKNWASVRKGQWSLIHRGPIQRFNHCKKKTWDSFLCSRQLHSVYSKQTVSKSHLTLSNVYDWQHVVITISILKFTFPAIVIDLKMMLVGPSLIFFLSFFSLSTTRRRSNKTADKDQDKEDKIIWVARHAFKMQSFTRSLYESLKVSQFYDVNAIYFRSRKSIHSLNFDSSLNLPPLKSLSQTKYRFWYPFAS